MEALILHTTRGILNMETLKEAQAMHNAFVTQGSQPGIEIARSPESRRSTSHHSGKEALYERNNKQQKRNCVHSLCPNSRRGDGHVP